MMFIGDNIDDVYDQEEFLGREVASLWYFSLDDLAEDARNIASKYILHDYARELYDDACIKWEEQIQATNNAHAHYQLGYYYQHGHLTSGKDYTRALQHYKAAIDQDYAPAMYDICSLYGRQSKDNPSDYLDLLKENEIIQMKVKMYVKAAAVGQHRKAAFQTFQRYKYMKQWRTSIDELDKEFKAIIKKNQLTNKSNLGNIYNQLGFIAVIKSQLENKVEELKSAYDYFHLAGKLGNPSGYLNYGYYKYENHDKYIAERTKYYLKAAQMGHYLGWYMLMRYLITSDALNPAELDRCLTYLKTASQYQTADFLSQLGVLHLESQLQSTSNEVQAFQYFLQATLSNESMSVESVGRHEFFYVGFMYEHGIGIEKDVIKAAHFYASSVIYRGDSSLALCRLAKLIEKCKIMPADINDAVKLLETAGTYNKSELKIYAHYRLARIFSDHNLKSIGLYSKDSSRRHLQGIALDILGKITQHHLRSTECYLIGKMNENGYFVEKDYRKAIHYYQLAVMCYSESDVHERYYSFKAMVRKTKLLSRNNTDYQQELNFLDNSIYRLQQNSPVDVYVQCYHIAWKYGTLDHFGYQLQLNAVQKYQQQLETLANANAYYQLGYFHQHGIGPVRKDFHQALQYYQVAIRLNHPLAHYDLCWLYGCEENGDDQSVCIHVYNTAKNYADVMMEEFVQSAALDGDLRSLKTLRHYYSQNNDCRTATKELVERLQKRLKNQHMTLDEKGKIYIQIAFLLWLTCTEISDQREFAKKRIIGKVNDCLMRAIEYGSPSASFIQLLVKGMLHEQHEVFNEDYTNIIKPSVLAGHIQAQYQLALYLLSFQEDRSTIDKPIVDYLRNAALLGLEEAPLEMSIMYRDGNNIVRPNLMKAAEFYDQYLIESHLAIGDCYQESFDIGFMHEHYLNQQHDYAIKAAFYYWLNIKNQFDSAYAQCYLAKLIEKRKIIGTAALDDAIQLYQTAAYLNCISIQGYAHYRLGKIYSNKSYQDIYDSATADNHFQVAHNIYIRSLERSSEKIPSDLYHLAILYQYGYGIASNTSQAIKYYQAAAEIDDDFLPLYDRYYRDKAKSKLNQIRS
ncbi:uncharacterized protein TRIADDRAFT_51450 [Trichoplax adhaerens]|uniref:Uncharacterized protein n=1 Tax=Trichoplax adhaerens TaxID=10228 RepID=B3RJ89_TRIAD|nr:hypothetical protein TRIADDRAFT_51450 [Trichoplax adhaerens]EDV28491.1 hypothetical protein TRIADDRAFT_51450 [Trichoplax adhaerens]|eukprot:XP_002107693.1 hypothetical protein TRIADDRAFT_51450 [Trichoplax adhaerens]